MIEGRRRSSAARGMRKKSSLAHAGADSVLPGMIGGRDELALRPVAVTAGRSA
jgi:hypothetical protein